MTSSTWMRVLTMIAAVGVAGSGLALSAGATQPPPGTKVPKQDKDEKDSKDKKGKEKAPKAGKTPKVGDTAPEWKAQTPDGKEVKLSDYKGKVVVMDFWATWCGPCKMAMPGVQKVHDKYKDQGVVVLGMNCWERGDAAAFMKDNKYTYNLVLKADDAATTYGLKGIPAFFVVDKEGKVLLSESGFSEGHEKKLEAAIDKALGGEKKKDAGKPADKPGEPKGPAAPGDKAPDKKH